MRAAAARVTASTAAWASGSTLGDGLGLDGGKSEAEGTAVATLCGAGGGCPLVLAGAHAPRHTVVVANSQSGARTEHPTTLARRSERGERLHVGVHTIRGDLRHVRLTAGRGHVIQESSFSFAVR